MKIKGEQERLNKRIKLAQKDITLLEHEKGTWAIVPELFTLYIEREELRDFIIAETSIIADKIIDKLKIEIERI